MSQTTTNLSSTKASTAEPSAVQKWLSASAQHIGAQSAALVVNQSEGKTLLAQVPRDQRPTDRPSSSTTFIRRLPGVDDDADQDVAPLGSTPLGGFIPHGFEHTGAGRNPR